MQADGRVVNVLVVDDNEDDFLLTRALVDRIDGAPYRLDWVSDYDEAVVVIRRGTHDICLLDHQLRERTGLELLREVVLHGVTIPIIFLTGDGSAGMETAALAAGATDFLAKGRFDGDGLWRALRHALERTRALDAVRQRDRLFRAVFDTALDAMLIADDEGRYVDGNPAALELFGVTREELLGKAVFDFAPPGATAAEVAVTWAQFRRDGTQAGEWPVQRADGHVRVLDYRATADILPNRHLSILRDVTDRKRAQAALARFATIVDSAEDAIFARDLDGTIREWNPGAERIYGCPASEAIGTSIKRFVPEDQMGQWEDVQRKLTRGEAVKNLETVRRTKMGAVIDMSLTISPLRDETGAVVGACTIARDITETTRLRAGLAMADRLASVGVLAAGVAHEINNPLAAVIGNIDIARKHVAAAPRGEDAAQQAEEELRDAADAAERVRQIVRDLKLFSRPDEVLRGPTDVQRPLEATLRVVWNEVRHRARLVKDYGATPTVDANEGQLGQVFLNLVLNAAHAIPEGSAGRHEIRITTRHVGGRVLIDISDTGRGIPHDQLGRIFEPFYTTKPTGLGTGLGLAICHGIIAGLGGDISVESEVGRGTTVHVALPVGVMAPAGPPPPPAGETARRRGRILIIDDEPMLVRLFTRVLEQQHETVGVTKAEEALRLLVSGEHFDVIVCDLMMPQMTGMELYAELERRAPDVARRVIFLTGGAFTPSAQQFLDRVPNLRLEKPCSPSTLLAVVRDLVS